MARQRVSMWGSDRLSPITLTSVSVGSRAAKLHLLHLHRSSSPTLVDTGRAAEKVNSIPSIGSRHAECEVFGDAAGSRPGRSRSRTHRYVIAGRRPRSTLCLPRQGLNQPDDSDNSTCSAHHPLAANRPASDPP